MFTEHLDQNTHAKKNFGTSLYISIIFSIGSMGVSFLYDKGGHVYILFTNISIPWFVYFTLAPIIVSIAAWRAICLYITVNKIIEDDSIYRGARLFVIIFAIILAGIAEIVMITIGQRFLF